MLTGGDTIRARFLYQSAFEFRPAMKLWLAANHAPAVDSEDNAMWRRILRVPFEHTIPKEKRDPRVKATLTDPGKAGPAILAWAVRGCREWQGAGLGVPPVVEKATEELRRENDPFTPFLDSECVFEERAEVAAGVLRDAYEAWAKENGVKPVVGKAWGEQLRARGCEQIKRTGGSRFWLGVRFTEPDEQPTAPQEPTDLFDGEEGETL